MSVVTALSLVLLVGFLATGLVGFLGWRQRMREGAVFSPIKSSGSPDQHANIATKDRHYGLQGARS